MAFNDMEVAVYRVLRYLDECLKAGKTPTKEDIIRDCQLYKLPEKYADAILEELSNNGYAKGIRKIETKNGGIMFVQDNVRITLAGHQYLTENSRMREVRDFLGKAFEMTVKAAVEALLP